jgi:hypothetical protein
MTNTSCTVDKETHEAEILKHVFKYLRIIDLKNISLTCKAWEKLSRAKRFSVLILSKLGLSVKLSSFLIRSEEIREEAAEFSEISKKYGSYIKTFATDYSLDQKTIQNLIDPLSNINSFTLYGCFNITVGSLAAYLQPLKNLQILKLSQIDILNRGDLSQSIIKFPDTLKLLYLEGVCDKPLAMLGLPQNFTNIKLDFLSNASLEFLNHHKSIEQLSFYDSHKSLLRPFIKTYPTLKKVVIGNYFQADFNQEIIQIIQNNPQLTSIHIYGCKKAKIFIKTVLKCIQELSEFVVYSFNSFSNHYYEHYLGVCYKFSIDKDLLALDYDENDLLLFSSQLIQKMTNLTLINVKLNFQYHAIVQVIASEAKNLTHLILYSPKTEDHSVHSDVFMSKFFKDAFYGNKYKCCESLISIEFKEFNILNFKVEYLNQFINLYTIKFIKLFTRESREETRAIVSKFEKAKNWKVFHDYSTRIGITEFISDKK